jgi:hypothetical protein
VCVALSSQQTMARSFVVGELRLPGPDSSAPPAPASQENISWHLFAREKTADGRDRRKDLAKLESGTACKRPTRTLGQALWG